MAHVAFLGTGLLATGLIEAMLRRQDPLVVWNRTASKAAALEQLGARVAATPADAVRGADRVHVTLSDDAAVDEVLDAAVTALVPTTLVIDHTTTSVAGTVARYARLGSRVRFLHAPVFMSPDMARSSAGILMTSGPEAAVRDAEPALRAMSSDFWYLGDDPGRAAAYKLFGNSLFFVITAGLSDVFAMAGNVGLSPANALEVFSRFQAGSVIKTRGEKMARHDFAASFELTMARKDIGLMIEAAGDRPLTVLTAIARRMDEAIANGHGQKDLGALMIASEPA